MLFDSTKINLGKLNVRSADQASSISIGNTIKKLQDMSQQEKSGLWTAAR